jgi:uncharacterized protein
MIMKRYVICLISIFMFLFACGFDREQQKVYDNADLLSEEEEESLNQKCMEAAQKYKADFVIVTADSLEGRTAEQYADDFYDYNGFGYEEQMGTGTLFLIAMDEREVHFSASGDCEKVFKYSSDKIVEGVTPYLSDGDYYNGFVTYIEKTGEYIKNGGRSNSQHVIDLMIQIVASLVVASITIWIMYSGSRSKMTVNGYTYASGHKSEVLQHHDVFQRTTTVRRHIDRSPKGGSGGSHVGSSGNSHSGSGGRF